MILFPAIDILGGKCVRLTQGDYHKEKIYSEQPVEVAVDWEKKGQHLSISWISTERKLESLVTKN